MTVPAFAVPFGVGLPSQQERDSANHLRTILASAPLDQDQRLTVIPERGRQVEIVLTPALTQVLMQMLRPLGRGDAVVLVPLDQMLTTQQAADILNVSRPYLIGLLERGAICFEMVGRHRRIRAADVLAYKEARDERRAAALDALAAGDADLL